jgi:tRNA-2-methylthio-N6-dimethylallyladenosine synthase
MDWPTGSSKIMNELLAKKVTSNISSAKPAKLLYIESYGCAMNFSDSEIVASVLARDGYTSTQQPELADLILLNTCSIREKAEQTVRNRLKHLRYNKKQKPHLKIGILGCMAERLKTQWLDEEKLVDIVAGPDAYRQLPELLEEVDGGQKAVNVLLSREETYADISPVKLGENGVSSFVSIMRGCDNMCSFCVVPFTRGRERSRDPQSICREIMELSEMGFKEVTLLGQNVDSYRWNISAKGEIKDAAHPTVNFAQLLAMAAEVDPSMRIRFSTSHPKDMTDDVLHTISSYPNICNYIHLPVQSGNNEVLSRMNRGYTREWYLDRIKAIRQIIPKCGISTDIISGFCGETEDEHQETLSLLREVGFDFAYMYKYSERPKTLAERKFKDDVPEEIKSKRLSEIIALQQNLGKSALQRFLNEEKEILVEGPSKRDKRQWTGRLSENNVVVFPYSGQKAGDYVKVRILKNTGATLIGEII